MTCSTPVPLVRTGQGVSFLYFSFWVPLSQLKHHPETTLKHWMWLLDPSDQKLPTLFSWPHAVPAPLFYHSDLVPTSIFPFAHHTSGPSGPIPNYTFCPFAFQHPLPPGPSRYASYAASSFQPPTPPPLWRRQWWWPLEMVHPGWQGRGLTRLQEGDWHQNRISPKLDQEFLLPELVHPPLAGALVLKTPIEFHSDSKHTSTFYGGYFTGL